MLWFIFAATTVNNHAFNEDYWLFLNINMIVKCMDAFRVMN